MTLLKRRLRRSRHGGKRQTRLYRILDLGRRAGSGDRAGGVESFGFDPKLLPPTSARRRQGMTRGGHPYAERLPTGQHRPLIFNYVRLKAGGTRILRPVLEAVY